MIQILQCSVCLNPELTIFYLYITIISPSIRWLLVLYYDIMFVCSSILFVIIIDGQLYVSPNGNSLKNPLRKVHFSAIVRKRCFDFIPGGR